MTLLMIHQTSIDPCAALEAEIANLNAEVADLQAILERLSSDLVIANDDISSLDTTVATLVAYRTRVLAKAALVQANTVGKPVGDQAWKKGVGTMLTVAKS